MLDLLDVQYTWHSWLSSWMTVICSLFLQQQMPFPFMKVENNQTTYLGTTSGKALLLRCALWVQRCSSAHFVSLTTPVSPCSIPLLVSVGDGLLREHWKHYQSSRTKNKGYLCFDHIKALPPCRLTLSRFFLSPISWQEPRSGGNSGLFCAKKSNILFEEFHEKWMAGGLLDVHSYWNRHYSCDCFAKIPILLKCERQRYRIWNTNDRQIK